MFESNNDDQKKANNGEEILPSLRFDGNDEIGINLSSYQYGNNQSRLNRLPSADSSLFSADNNQKAPSLSLLNEPLGENNSFSADLISSLMSDQARTPLGLMQEDFPATPSSLYSNRLLGEDVRFETDMQAAELKVVSSLTEDTTSNFLSQSSQRTGSASSVLPPPAGSESPSRINPLMSSGHLPSLISSTATGNVDDFEQAAKSLQQLYVNPELSTLAQNAGANQLLAQYHSSLAAGGISNASFFTNASAGVNATGATAVNPAMAPSANLSLLSGQQFIGSSNTTSESVLSTFPLANNNAANASNASGNNSNNAPNPSVMANPAPGLDPNASVFNGMLPGSSMNPAFLTANANAGNYPGILGGANLQAGANATMLQGNVVPPLANPSLLQGQGQMPNVLNAQGQQQQAPYFVQPPMFMGPNGQPMFFRPPGQFGQEFMYSQVDANGMPIPGAPMVTDPNQLQFAQQQLAQGFMQYPGMPGMPGAGMIPPGYWPNGTPDQTGASAAAAQAVAAAAAAGTMPQMFMNNQQGVRMPMQGMDDPSRMLYNPAMYNGMQGVPGMVGQGNVPGMPFAMNNNMMQMPMAQNANGAVPGMMGRPMMPMNGDQNNGYAIMSPDGTVMNAGNDNSKNNNNRNGGNDNNRGNNRNNNNRNNNNNNNNSSNNNNNNSNNNNNNNNNANGNNNNNANSGGNTSAVRDPLVEEFRSTFGKSRQWTLGDLSGHIVAFCQDQHGSRFIQQRLEVCTEVEKQLVFDEILPSAQILMTDVFGNYVLQKLFEYGSKEQCEQLAMLLKGQAVQLSMQMYGCRVVQKALEYVSTERLVDLVSEFESPQMLIRCVHDSNGNHVIQKCIEVVSKCAKDAQETEQAEYLSSRIQFIIDAFTGQVKELSSHPYGCRVVQRILEHCTNNQKAVILEELRQCCSELVQDCYGNYVIQFVMQHGWDADRAVLIREVQTNLLDFSQHKFASNVVEKCLQYASKKDRDEMIWTIINVTFDLNNPVDSKGHCVLESMVRDPYANYVVQKVIDVSDERQRGAIMRYVKDNINQLRKYTYGKHIIVRLEKITNEKF